MSFYPEQNDINILFQPSKQIYSKVEILNKDYMPISSVHGRLISDSYNVDSTSSVRRTYNCTLQIESPTLEFDKNNELWFDKYVRPYVGIYDNKSKNIIWYLKGTYSTLNATHSFDASTNTLSVVCNDLMCRLTGDLDGKQTGQGFKIETGDDIKQDIIDILKYFDFTKYNIADLPLRVQHDLEFSAGTPVYQMISSMMEFAPNYEFFFDIDGTFVVQRLPCYTNDSDILSDEIIQELLVSQNSYTMNFTAKNCVEVWGKSFDENSIDRMASDCTSSDGSLYDVRITNGLNSEGYEIDWAAIPDYLIFAVTTPNISNQAGCQMKVRVVEEEFGPYTIYDEYDKPLKAGVLQPNKTYVFCHDVKTETVLESDLNLVGMYDDSRTYNYNDVVVWSYKDTETNKDIYNTYIARYEKEEEYTVTTPDGETETRYRTIRSFSGEAPRDWDTEYWKKITFTTAFELVGVYSNEETYASTDLVMYNGGMYYCLKNDTTGVEPGSDRASDSPTWESLNLNVNTIKIENIMRYYCNMVAHGVYKNENDSKFSIAEMGREYWEILSGGEYDNILSDTLAQERAIYEALYKANLNESLSLTLVDIPWLDVNKKISYRRALGTEIERWMINSISSETLSGTCSVNLSKFYPDWSEIKDQYLK